MKRFPFTTLATLLIVVPFGSIRAADQDAKAILEKAAAALGGKDKLAKVDAMTWKAKGKISFNGNSNEFKSESTVKGLTHFHSQFHGNFDGNPIEMIKDIEKRIVLLMLRRIAIAGLEDRID